MFVMCLFQFLPDYKPVEFQKQICYDIIQVLLIFKLYSRFLNANYFQSLSEEICKGPRNLHSLYVSIPKSISIS